MESTSSFNVATKEKIEIIQVLTPTEFFFEFLKQLTLNIDSAFSASNHKTLMRHYNKNYLNKSKKDNLKSIITTYQLKFLAQMMQHESVHWREHLMMI